MAQMTTEEKRTEVLRLVAEGMNLAEASRAIGEYSKWANNQRQSNPDFAMGLARVKEQLRQQRAAQEDPTKKQILEALETGSETIKQIERRMRLSEGNIRYLRSKDERFDDEVKRLVSLRRSRIIAEKRERACHALPEQPASKTPRTTTPKAPKTPPAEQDDQEALAAFLAIGSRLARPYLERITATAERSISELLSRVRVDIRLSVGGSDDAS